MMRSILESIAANQQLDDSSVDFALCQIANLPPIPRYGISLLAFIFSLHALISNGATPFHLQESTRQIKLQQCWQQTSFMPCRNFILFCNSLLLFAHYSMAKQKQ